MIRINLLAQKKRSDASDASQAWLAVVMVVVLAEVAARHPGLSITYVEAEPPEAVEAVRENRADIALTFSYPGDRDDPHGSSASGLAVRAVGADDLLVVLPVGHRVAEGERVEVGAVASLEELLFGPSRIADGTTNLVGALRRAMATTGYTELKDFQRVEVVVSPYGID
jgi:DNA-binding transcriptional LysR family regulator